MGLFKSIGKIAKSVGKVIPGVGDVISASDSKKATKKASQAQIDALNKAITGLNTQFEQTSGNLNPIITAGNDALTQIRGLAGLNGFGEQQGAIDALKASPLYQSLFDNGQEAILGAASATGGLRGGNINEALADFGRDTLAQTILQQLGVLGGIQGQGQSAAMGLGQFGAQNAGSVADLTTGIGNVNAGRILGVQAIDNNLYSGLRQQVSNAIAGGAGGAGGGLGSILGGSNGLLSKFGGLFGGSGGIQGNFPGITGASSQPFNLGTIDTTPLIQKIGF